MGGCAAVNCHNTTKNFRLFAFPSDPIRRAKWVRNMRRDKFTPTKGTRLCEHHFESSQFEQKRQDGWKKLKPNAVPTLFDVPNAPPKIDPLPRKSTYKFSEISSKKLIHDAIPTKSACNNEGNFYSARSDALSSSHASVERTRSSCKSSEESCYTPYMSPNRVEESSEDTEVVLEDDESYDKLVSLENLKEELCRICGHTANSLIPIFGDTFLTRNLSLSLPEVLEMHLQLELHADDQFPPNICSKCLNIISEWHELYATCIAADKAFRNAFGRRKVEGSAITCVKLSEEESQRSVAHPVLEDHDYIQEMNEIREEEVQLAVDVPVLNEHYYLGERFLCKYCCESFKDKEQLNVHKKLCQENSTICEICGRRVINKNLVKHRYKKHGRKVICDKCGKFVSTHQLYTHMKSAHSGAKYCEVCCSVIHSSLAYTAHMKNHASGKSTSTFPFISVSFDGKSVYKCPVCDKSFDDKISIIVHFNEPMCIKCPTCRITFKKKKTFILHKCKYWNCQFCTKKFYNRLLWKEHERIHTGERPHKCEECNISFRTMNQKAAHAKNHRAPVLECKYCCKKFWLPGKLIDHMNCIHEGVRYTCKICNKIFSRKLSMEKHLQNHLHEVKHFSCEVCDKKFTREVNMKKHLENHLHEVKYFSCEVCDKKFTREVNMKKHLEKHVLKVQL